jgi:hypothetical protein
LAKKKKAAVPSTFNPAQFRRGEEASMASLANITPPAGAEESGTITGIQRQQEIYDPNQVVDPVKRAIAEETERLRTSVDNELDKAADDLAAIIAQAEADIAEAERLAKEATAAAELAEKQMAEAEGFKEEALKGEIIAFNLDSTATFSGLTPEKQANVSRGMFDGNAAFTALFSSLSSLGLEGLVDVLNNIRSAYPDINSEDALLLLKYDKRYNEPYLKRFEGNRKRMAAGLAPLDDATYLSNEAAYAKIFTSYGLKQFANRERYANFIGSDIAPDEVAARVQVVYDRVNNAMPQVSKALLQFYPELTTQDLMAYTLDPVNQLPVIQRKVQAAEIGGAALAQSLGTSLQATTFTGAQAAPYSNVTRGTIGVETMLKAGTDAAQAAKAAAYVADVLPVSEKLSSIYANGYGQYGQVQAEQEAYLGSIEAKKAREALVGRERAEFSGTAGMLKSQRRAVGGLI